MARPRRCFWEGCQKPTTGANSEHEARGLCRDHYLKALNRGLFQGFSDKGGKSIKATLALLWTRDIILSESEMCEIDEAIRECGEPAGVKVEYLKMLQARRDAVEVEDAEPVEEHHEDEEI